MQEILAQLKTIARRTWKFRWPGLLAAWAVGIAGALVVFKVPDQYEASARVFVDTQSILKPLMAGLTVQPNVEQQVGMLSRTLLSRLNVERLVRTADLDLKATTKAQQEALIERLLKTREVRSTNRDNLYTLTYRDIDPERSKRVIQSLVSIFIESGLAGGREQSVGAKAFLNGQIKLYEQRLEAAEARLKEFRTRNIELQTADGRDTSASLGEISRQLEQVRLELHEAETARDAAQAQLDMERSGSQSVTGNLLQESDFAVATPEIDARIEGHKRQLEALLQRFTDQHPDIVASRRLIKDLEDQKKKDVAEQRKLMLAAAARRPPAPKDDLAAQEMRRTLASAEVQVAVLRARLAEYSSRYAQARTQLKTSPQIAAEAAQLNRDYAVIKKSYDELVSRREAAVMSGDLDMATGVAEFRVIDPPRVSPQPVSPNRLLLYAAALAAAVAAGVFVAFAASQLRPVYNATFELGARTGLPVLGVVSLVMSGVDARRIRMDTWRFVAGAGTLVALYGAGLIAVAVLAARHAA